MHVRFFFFINFCLGEDLMGGFVPVAALYLLRLRKKGKKEHRAVPCLKNLPRRRAGGSFAVNRIRCLRHSVLLTFGVNSIS